MRKYFKPCLLGFIAGMIVMGLCVWFLMPKMMIHVYESKLGFDETVSSVEEAVNQYDQWKAPKTFDIGQSVIDAGFEDMTGVKIVTLCHPNYVYRILSQDKDKMVATLMPLGIAVYESNDGKVFISDMNIGMMGMMFGGTISEVMGEASNDISKILDGIVQD